MMNKSGPIIVIEDDVDDRESIQLIYDGLGYKNELIFIEDGDAALDYLKALKSVPFLIISDINMPKMDGLQLRDLVYQNKDINYLCIPYIMLSTTVEKKSIDKAFSTGVQGYFQKPSNYKELETTLVNIIEYWKRSFTPGNYMPQNFSPMHHN